MLSEELPMFKFTTFQGVNKSLEGIKREGRVELMMWTKDPASKLGGRDDEAKLGTTGLSLPFSGSEGGAGLSETLGEFAL